MKKKNILPLFFSLSYFFVCLIIGGFSFEGSWGGFLYFILAMPFSIISLKITNYIGGMPLFIFLNAIWWYVAVRLLIFIRDYFRS